VNNSGNRYLLLMLQFFFFGVIEAASFASIVRLADGRVFKLERYEFQNGSGRYDLPNHLLARWLESVLPGSIAQRLKWLEPRTTAFINPNFPGEPLLSAAFTIPNGSCGWQSRK
jgi:hypothetical protein